MDDNNSKRYETSKVLNSHKFRRNQELKIMSEKKVVSRTVAIALGIIIIVFAVSLAGAIAYYTSIIGGKDSTIASYSSQVNSLTNIVNLKNSSIWLNNQTIGQPAGSYTSWTFSASYAGYVAVGVQQIFVQNSNFNWLYAQVIYSYSQQGYQFTYNNTISLDRFYHGIAVFPILASPQFQAISIQIRVGNYNNQIQINPPSTAYEAVTITYYY